MDAAQLNEQAYELGKQAGRAHFNRKPGDAFIATPAEITPELYPLYSKGWDVGEADARYEYLNETVAE